MRLVSCSCHHAKKYALLRPSCNTLCAPHRRQTLPLPWGTTAHQPCLERVNLLMVGKTARKREPIARGVFEPRQMELVPAGFILDRRPARPCSSGERGRPPSRARPPERGCDWGRRLERGTAGLGRGRLERGATGGSKRESTLATARRFILSLILHGLKII